MNEYVKLKMKDGVESFNQRFSRVSVSDGEGELNLDEIPLFEVKPTAKAQTVSKRILGMKTTVLNHAKKKGQAVKFKMTHIFKNEDETVYIYQKQLEEGRNSANGKKLCTKANCQQDRYGDRSLCHEHYKEKRRKYASERKKNRAK